MMNTSSALNFTRSAMAPTMSPGVIAANVAWKMKNPSSGMFVALLKVPVSESPFIPFRNILLKPPKNWLVPSLKATEYP